MNRSRRPLGAAFAALPLVIACQPAPPQQPVLGPDPCVVFPGTPIPDSLLRLPPRIGTDARTTTVVLQAPVLPDSVLRPVSASARLLTAQLYETLVRVDCTSALRPGLATAWSDSAGTIWRFTLRTDAAFADGSKITARTVADGWMLPGRMASAAIAALDVLDEHVLRVELHQPARAHLFADPVFAIMGRPERGGWPAASRRAAHAAAGVAVTVTVATGRATVFASNADLRQALDHRSDVIVTDDPDVISYAAALREYAAVPLPWSRTYVLATPGFVEEPRIPTEAAISLARDVVRHGRAAQGPVWWESEPCGVPGVRFRAHAEARNIAYPRGDRAAQNLAERIVALGSPAGSAPSWLRALLPPGYGAAGPLRAVALDENSLLQALRARLPLAVVTSVPSMPDALCAGLFESAALEIVRGGWQITPLIDVRDVLLHRAHLDRTVVDGFGIIRIQGP